MNGWLTQLLGEQGATWTLYILGGAVVLVLAWVAWFWTRRVAGGVFVEGGRNRKHRLAVVDATAVDSSRRIVLVRRDDVEHLVMIGGQNDFVIESNIESTPAETAQRGQPRDRRGREAQAPSQGRRPLRREPTPAPAKPAARDEAPRPTAPAPTPPPQPAGRETAAPEAHPATAPIAAASGAAASVAATPAFLRRVPEPAPAPPQSESPSPATQPTVEPLRPEPPERAEPAFYAEGSAVAARRTEPFVERNEPLVQAPEPPQPQAEPEPLHLREEVALQVAVQESRPPQPGEPVRAEATEPVEREEEQDAVAEEAFTALFARGQGNGSTFAERFMFHTAKAAEEPVTEQAQEPAAAVAPPEPAAAFHEPEPIEIETDEQSSGTLTAEHAPEDQQHAEEMEAAVETALAQEMEPIAEFEETTPETSETVDGEGDPETAAQQAPDNDDAERPSDTLEDEMHRLLAQLTTGKR
ncbi:MAG: flagellar biosynthetic protein FliO [Oricola sp.]|nr:flagellar biosynthetic protein FliO [Oricola sp.]